MTTQIDSPRGRIAANVSAELKRQRLSTKSLTELIGGSYSYWQRRTSAELPFAADELLAIAQVLDVPIDTFFQGARVTGGTRGPGGGNEVTSG